jgi:hypothetical protein
MSKHKWLDRVVVAHDLDVDAKAVAIDLFPHICEDGSIADCSADDSCLEVAGYVRDGFISLP